MKFRPTKLPRDVASTLRLCPISTVKPHAIMIAPVYVYMRANEKFIAVKGPLDFFTEAELNRLKPLETFYFTTFMERSLVFREKARFLRSLMTWVPDTPGVEPAPFEKSDVVLRALAPLWGSSVAVESFFVAVFVGELCGQMNGESLVRVRERDVDSFSRAIMVSSWSVFVALHCGWLDLDLLARLRQWSFSRAGESAGNEDSSAPPAFGSEEIHALASKLVDGYSSVGLKQFDEIRGVFSSRMKSRLKRVESQLKQERGSSYTIFGPEGISDG